MTGSAVFFIQQLTAITGCTTLVSQCFFVQARCQVGCQRLQFGITTHKGRHEVALFMNGGQILAHGAKAHIFGPTDNVVIKSAHAMTGKALMQEQLTPGLKLIGFGHLFMLHPFGIFKEPFLIDPLHLFF